jgi:hypothetical protein
MQSHYIYQDTNIRLKISFKNTRRSSPTRDHTWWPLETQAEEINRDTNLAESFAVLTTTLNKLNIINMPSSTKDYIVRKATSLQNRANDIRQQQLQQQAITETIFWKIVVPNGEMCWIYRNWKLCLSTWKCYSP